MRLPTERKTVTSQPRCASFRGRLLRRIRVRWGGCAPRALRRCRPIATATAVATSPSDTAADWVDGSSACHASSFAGSHSIAIAKVFGSALGGRSESRAELAAMPLPLAAIGAFGLLWLLEYGGKAGFYPPIPAMNINLFSQIGLVLLVGLVTKNSILLVEYTITARNEQGLDRNAALIDAARKRARPVVMTTVAMGAGMMPIAFGIGADAEFRAPMAIAVIGGLLSSTALSLIYVPAVFTVMDDLDLWARTILRALIQIPRPELRNMP